jgi:hypothetical protein
MAYPKKMRIGIFNRLVNGGEGMGGFGFTPLSLFKNNEQGAWYDPSDISTLFQDAAGSTPVTSDGDPVGYMGDKSGNGHHATQSISASRPIYKTDGTLHWLQFDGVDDNLSHPYSSGTSDLTLAGGGVITKNSRRQQLMGAGAANTRLTSLLWPRITSANEWGTYGSNDVGSGDSALNDAIVMINIGNYANRTQNLYTDGQLAAAIVGSYAGDPINRRFIGSEKVSDNFMEGRIYGIVAVSKEISGAELALVNSYLATKSGVTL